MENPLIHPFLFLYTIWQILLDKLLSPAPPLPGSSLHRPKIAVIGAGITGVSSAAHCVGHGFDVHIFEAGTRESLGGIWARVNNTSGLQIHSIMYRFFPSIRWTGGYPNRQQIVSQVEQLWKTYGLEHRTTFNCPIETVYQDERGRWIVNNTSLGRFEGVIAAVGTCGDEKMPKLPGLDNFKGDVYHSSRLTVKNAKGKRMIIIGGGASAVEALEFAAHEGASKTYILARSEKWIIPRNPVVNVLLALNVFGQETLLSWIPEMLLRKLFYRDLEDIAPSGKGLFTSTPMVNSDIMDKLRDGSAEWLRGDIAGVTDTGVNFSQRLKGVPKGGSGKVMVVEGDIIVMATGYERPSLSFLPSDCFEEPYMPPNWYMQSFPPAHPSILACNCTYRDGLGAVGNWHIGIYTRILLMMLSDPLTRPRPFWMKRWIDMTRFLKSHSPIGAFDFFTYSELIWWFTFCIAINPFRWKWGLFVFTGVGIGLPLSVVKREEKWRSGNGQGKGEKGKEAEERDVGRSF